MKSKNNKTDNNQPLEQEAITKDEKTKKASTEKVESPVKNRKEKKEKKVETEQSQDSNTKSEATVENELVVVEDNPKKKRKRKGFTKRGIAGFLVLCFLGITSGSIIGVWFRKNFMGGSSFDYSTLSEASIRGTETEHAIAVTQGFSTKTPTKDNLIYNFIAAEYNYKNHATSFHIRANGVVNTIIGAQDVYSEKFFDGTTVCAISTNKGTIDVAEMTVQNILTPDDISVYNGKGLTKTYSDEKINCPFGSSCSYHNKTYYTNKSDYNVTPKKMTEAQYIEEMGFKPINLISYIVSSQTVLNKAELSKTFKVITLSDGTTGYAFSLNLHPQLSVLNYAQQMKHTSGLDSYPTFSSVKVNVVLSMVDGRVQFKYLDSDEAYTVKYGPMYPKCTSQIHQEFNFNVPVTLPV